MKILFEQLRKAICSGRDAVLVTVVASSGSTPRGSGARMLVTDAGREYGTIGGGAVEYRSEQIAMDVLRKKASGVERFRLHSNDVADLGMVCGGTADVFFQYIPAYDEEMSLVSAQTDLLIRAGEQCWLICEVTQGHAGRTAVYSASSGMVGADIPAEVLSPVSRKAQMVELGERIYYCEQLLDSGRVYVFGGGHVAQELVPALSKVGFRCVVVEDRPEFARRELFPTAEDILLLDLMDLSALAAGIRAEDYICIMTRGHQHDLDVQRQVLCTPARYIGVIGSAQKAKTVGEKLKGFGYTQEDLSRIVSPIGLDIGGETPAEIAVSVTAQLIQVRAGHTRKA